MKNTAAAIMGAIGILAAGAASAADIAMPAMPGPVVVSPSVPVDAGFNWNRFYGGLQGGVWIDLAPRTIHSVRGAAMVGRNVVLGDRLVVGAEAIGGGYFTPDYGIFFDVMGMARAGILLGDRVLAYGTVGIGYDFGPDDEAFMVAGAGVELSVRSNLGIRSEVLAFRYLGDPFSFVSATVGLSWYFGR